MPRQILRVKKTRTRHEEEDHDKCNNVQTGIETECCHTAKSMEHLNGNRFDIPPTGVKADCMRGKVNESTDAQNKFVATAHDIPISLCVKGKTSAEYVKGTGPSPGE